MFEEYDVKTLGLFYISKLITFYAGFYGCFILHHAFAVPVVVSAATVGLLGSFIPYTSRFKRHPQAAVYAGAFAGMCSQDIIQTQSEIITVSLVGAFIYTLLRNVFVGIGGKLGAIAFTAVASVVLVKGLVL
ncbi:hypothetical protein KUL152_01480 [Tenacibaculum sp. KUL152]|nr:hypothetical protein KUL152_01480 [Tenacibaculum sp. KUL152]